MKRRKKRTKARRPAPPVPQSVPTPPPAHPRGRRLEPFLVGILLGVMGLGLLWLPVSDISADVGKVAGRKYSSGSGSTSGKSSTSGSKGLAPPSSGKKYSSGGNPSPPAGSAKPKAVQPPPPSFKPSPVPSGKSGSTDVPKFSGKNSSSKPSGATYDQPAGQEQRHEESRSNYENSQRPPSPPKPPPILQPRKPAPPATYPKPSPPQQYPKPPPPPVIVKGEAPKPTYTDRSGAEHKVDPKDPGVEQLRKQLDEKTWANRKEREEQVFRNTPPQAVPPPVYNDPFNDLLIVWLLQQSLEQRAEWVYHHREQMDRRRYDELIAKDRELDKRLRELEEAKKPKEPTYTPKGIDPDLMYNDRYAEAAFNPKKATPPEVPKPQGASWGLRVVTVLAVALLFGFVMWLVFVKRWGGD